MRNLFVKILFRTIAVSLLAAFPLLEYSQPAPRQAANAFAQKLPEMHGGDTTEKSIAVDKNVNISLCVTQGNLKVNGWNRTEVRVFIKNGTKFGFKVQEKNKQDIPVWIMLNSFDSKKGENSVPSECISGEEIEIDAPLNAKIDIKGQETKTTIDTVRKASVKTIGGDINLRNVAEGITATTYEGDVTVEQSMGPMMLETTTGNILVFNAGPSQIGDIFKAKTNGGNVSLQRLDYREVDVGSISGSVAYSGDILTSGTYNLNTSNGSIRMLIPATSSCQVVASYGFGNFNSEIPIKIETELIFEGPAKRMVGKMGNGGATVRLTTNSGSIVIKKQ